MTDIPAWLIHRIEAIESRLNALDIPPRAPTMTINRMVVREQKQRSCLGCLFEYDHARCDAVKDVSRAVFGGTCGDRDVIYVEVE